MNNLKYRMYCFVLYNLSPIQQGIQSAHAVVEYSNLFGKTDEWKKWAGFDKTIIVLNGGTSKTLTEHYNTINEQNIPCAQFIEEDLYNNMTAFCFLVDERVWDRTTYPDVKPELFDIVGVVFDPHAEERRQNNLLSKYGTKQNIFLRDFLSNFRLA